MKDAKWILLIVLAVLAGWLWYSYKKDPLAGQKQGTVSEVTEPNVKETLDKALAAIEKNDMRGLLKMMSSTDPMYFDETYTKVMFAEKDFMPVEFKGMRKVERSEQTFYQADVLSTKRGKSYQFTIVEKKGKYLISAIEEMK